MNKRGFTLIELLAVISIIILLTFLVSFSIIKVLKNSKQNISSTQIKLIKEAANLWAIDNINYLLVDDDCIYITLKDLKEYGVLDSSIVDAINNQEISDDINIKISTINNNKYNIEIDSENITNCKVYQNVDIIGTEVYYDVSKGQFCLKSEYEQSYSSTYHDYLNSLTGYNGINGENGQNSCLKFYVIDSKDEVASLILDHNTTASTKWNDENSDNLPITILNKLKSDTSAWKNTITPSNYNFTFKDNTTYTINYEGYKARLITSSEIAKITNNDSFDERISSNTNWFNLNDLSQNNTSSNLKFNWLYDRTNSSCNTYGCLNNEFNTNTLGYWTSTSTLNNSAWYIDYKGLLYYSDKDSTNIGIRPVITIRKDINVNSSLKDLILDKVNTKETKVNGVNVKKVYGTKTEQTTMKNYVVYSSQLWEVVEINENNNTIKLVSPTSLTSISYGSTNNFDNSWVKKWLNEYFYS